MHGQQSAATEAACSTGEEELIQSDKIKLELCGLYKGKDKSSNRRSTEKAPVRNIVLLSEKTAKTFFQSFMFVFNNDVYVYFLCEK